MSNRLAETIWHHSGPPSAPSAAVAGGASVDETAFGEGQQQAAISETTPIVTAISRHRCKAKKATYKETDWATPIVSGDYKFFDGNECTLTVNNQTIMKCHKVKSGRSIIVYPEESNGQPICCESDKLRINASLKDLFTTTRENCYYSGNRENADFTRRQNERRGCCSISCMDCCCGCC